jgi:hypothetical protein
MNQSGRALGPAPVSCPCYAAPFLLPTLHLSPLRGGRSHMRSAFLSPSGRGQPRTSSARLRAAQHPGEGANVGRKQPGRPLTRPAHHRFAMAAGRPLPGGERNGWCPSAICDCPARKGGVGRLATAAQNGISSSSSSLSEVRPRCIGSEAPKSPPWRSSISPPPAPRLSSICNSPRKRCSTTSVE